MLIALWCFSVLLNRGVYPFAVSVTQRHVDSHPRLVEETAKLISCDVSEVCLLYFILLCVKLGLKFNFNRPLRGFPKSSAPTSRSLDLLSRVASSSTSISVRCAPLESTGIWLIPRFSCTTSLSQRGS